MRPISVRMPGGGHDRPAVAVGGGGAAEDHVVAVAERHVAGNRRRCPWPPAGSRRSAPLRPSAARSIRCSRASAGMVSPSSTRMTSPGTISAAGTLRRSPSRTTVRVGRGHRAQRGDGRLGARLLDVAHRRVQQHDGEDGERLVGQRRVALVAPRGRRRRRWRRAAGRRGRPGTARESAARRGSAASAASSLRPTRASRARASSWSRPRRGSVASAAARAARGRR